MDPINTHKIQANLKKYKKKQKQHLQSNVFFYFLTMLMCGLFFFSPLWLSSLSSSMKVFFFVTIPKFCSFLFNTKSLFIVGNLIVIFLVGESKIFPSDSSRATDECVEKTHRLRKDPITCKKRKVDIKKDFKEIRMMSVDEKGRKEKESKVEKEDEERENYLDAEGGEDEGLPAEELNKRADDFIAKVNRQRRLEATLFFCSSDY